MQLRHSIEKVSNETSTTAYCFRRDICRRNTSRCKVSVTPQTEGDLTYLCPIENTISRWSSSRTASSTPLISGAAVMIRTPTEASSPMSQSFLIARFCGPYISSNEAKPLGADRIWRGACAPRLATCMKGPSACHPSSVAPFGWA
jgi:hypothetical protein